MSTVLLKLHTPLGRYAIGALISWPVYCGLFYALVAFGTWNTFAIGFSWALSYWVEYIVQRYEMFNGLSSREKFVELSRYSVLVIGSSTIVDSAVYALVTANFALNTKVAFAAASLSAMCVGYWATRRALAL